MNSRVVTLCPQGNTRRFWVSHQRVTFLQVPHFAPNRIPPSVWQSDFPLFFPFKTRFIKASCFSSITRCHRNCTASTKKIKKCSIIKFPSLRSYPSKFSSILSSTSSFSHYLVVIIIAVAALLLGRARYQTGSISREARMPEIEHVSENALFGKYEVGKLLGCGAFAKVYHARDVLTGKSVAIKIINKKKIANPSLMSNIKREISIMRKLNHPNIVKIIEVLASKTRIYCVMEYVKGGELFSKIAKGRFSEDLSRKYFRQLISAVGYCHLRGVFHRDLKPENLLLDENGNLKVSDFGLSAVRDQIQLDGLLHTLCGTPAYVAPEILTKKGYDGAKIDVWSCGVILFVLSAGYLPFNDPNLMAMYKKIYKGEFQCPKWMSTDLKRFLSRLLNTNPETRITIDEILKDPWFKKGKHKEVNFYGEEFNKGGDEKKDEEFASTSLNAFDIISFSSGLNLSGLFDDSYNVVDDGERLVSTESPEDLVKKVEEFAKEERLRVKRRKEWGLEMEGQNGNLMLSVEIRRLTDTLFVVEANRNGGDAGCYKEIWNNKLKPVINGLMSTNSKGNDD